MIPRGEVGLVFAGVGAASGVLSESLDAAIIVMVIVTTFIAPPLLKLVFDRDDGDVAEGLDAATGSKAETMPEAIAATPSEAAES